MYNLQILKIMNNTFTINLGSLSEEKIELLKSCYYGILQADQQKILNVINKHFETGGWLEEECTPNYSTITIKRTGLSTDLYINNKSSIDSTLEP